MTTSEKLLPCPPYGGNEGLRLALEQIVALRGYQGEDMGRVSGYRVAAEIAEKALRSDPSPVGETVGTDALIAAAEAGWNACRRQVYLLSEDFVERTHPLKNGESVEGNFYRGQYDVAKSFAKAFNAFEARDCDYFKQIDFACLTSAEGQSND